MARNSNYKFKQVWFSFKRRRFRYKIIISIFGIVLTYYIVMFLINLVEYNLDDSKDFIDLFQGGRKDENCPILLWWTPFTGDSGSMKKCGEYSCFFTDQRKHLNDPLTKAFLFYGSDFKPTDLPLPRSPSHHWALLHEESPKNNFLFSMEKVMRLFNHTATFRRESDLPLTLQYLDGVASITSTKYFVSTAVKNERGKTLSPLVYVHSDCNTPSERDSYVEELAKFIPVDSYGKCLQNKELPPHLSEPLTNMVSHDFFEILAQYKFNLAIENAACQDYITEKLWRPLTVGSVPIYFGSPAVEDWLPNPDSAILVRDFASPKMLADHLLSLLANDTAYERHLVHKTRALVSNARLLRALRDREWGVNNDPRRPSFIDSFECLVCRRVHEGMLRGSKFQATVEHYGCPRPAGPYTLKDDMSQSWWPELYDKAVYEARALENLVGRGTNYTPTDFYQEVINLLENSAVR